MDGHVDFRERAEAALGGRGWQALMSRALGVNPRTVKRWAAGELEVPEYAWAAVELLEAMVELRAEFPARWRREPQAPPPLPFGFY